jgi:S-DNA-T family DNA segregation ATPase FtsK/SpoIIIE
MANLKGKSKNKKNNKYATAQKEKLSASDFFVGFGKWETFSFCMGLLIGVFAIFMLVAFVSYLFTGEADYSLLESNTDPMNSELRYKNVCGSWGAIVAFFFLNDLFGLASFIIPPYLIILGMRMMRIFKFTLVRKFILFTVLMLWTSVFLAAFGYLFPYFEGTFVKLGGNHGIQVVKYLTQLVGTPGLLAVLVVTAVLYLIYLSAKTIEVIRDVFRLNFLKKANPRKWAYLMRKKVDEEDEESEEGDESGEQERDYESEGNDEPVEVLFPVDEDAELVEKEKNPLLDEVDDDPVEAQVEESTPAKESKLAETKMDIEANETEVGTGKIQRGDINTPYDPKLDLEHYKYPTLNLLRKADDQGPQIDMFEQNANKNRIIEVLKQFGVEIKSIKATIGPTITLYEIVPSEGTRISRIRNLEDDIALSLAAEGIRIIAPIPGKGTIGIEVPNKKKCIVSMESVINSRVYQESKMELPCAIGKTISNEVFMFDLAKAPHLLVAGATGQGKSVGLNAIVTSLLYKKHPSELKIVMVDPKKVEFSIYSPIENHFLARLEDEEECIITDVQKVVKTLNSLCALMDTRYDLLKRAHARTIKEYNEMFKSRKLNPEHGHEFMPYIVVIVDEFGDLIMTAGKEVELPICRIAQLARAVGIHMIIATQRPQASIISGAIKANFPTRIAFKVSSMIDSRVILDRPGANQLIGKGDMLYLGSAEPVRVQCAFVDTPEVNDICSYIAKQQSFLHPLYLPEVADPDSDGAAMGPMDKGKLDPMFADVAKFVVSNQSGSTSMIQRNYSIGYNRAGKIMDQLERMGVVGPQVGAKPREVLIKDPMTLESLLNSL